MRILLAILAPTALLAQQATLTGLVRDGAQSAIPGATLTALQTETGIERTAMSDAAGLYGVTALLPGHYKVTVEAKGFQPKTVENVELQAEQIARLDFALQGDAGEIRGTVADAYGGEALASVQIRLASTAYRTTSDDDGHFGLGGIPSGDYVLNVGTVGYHQEKQAFHLEAGGIKEFTVVLTADSLQQTATVNGNNDPFEPAGGDVLGALKLSGTDAKNLGGVFADDPLRAVQALPGVSSDDDFEARFSLRGADFTHIALYLDGVLVHEPFNEPKTQQTPGTITAFNADTVEDMELYEAAFPARFEDRTAGALNVTTRDGSRDATLFRADASVIASSLLGEGPLGGRGRSKGSWLVAVRKSYVQYLVNRDNAPDTANYDFEDLQSRLSYDFTPRLTATLSLLESFSGVGQSTSTPNLGPNSVVQGGYHYTLANAGWRYSPTPRLQIVSHAAWMRERYDNTTATRQPLFGGYYGEWVWNGSATWQWSEAARLEGGWSVRRMRDQNFSNQFQVAGQYPTILDHADGTALRGGGYVQQSWSGLAGRLRLSAGTRWDDQSADRVATVSPQASASFGVTRTTNLLVGWGQYVQYPELSVLFSPFGNRGLRPARSIQETVILEQKIGSRARLRAEVYERSDRDIPFQPYLLPRILNGQFFYSAEPLYYNSLRGQSSGYQVFLQRSSANRFTGWLSYAHGRDWMHDAVTGDQFFSDYDQRNTINAYGAVRVKPTVSLSLRVSYGSGFPIPAYIQPGQHGYPYSSQRDTVRVPAYQTTDFRINKSWLHDKWKFTLYGQVMNLTNHTNYFFRSSDIVSFQGRQSLELSKTFPILPSVGIAVEW